MGESFVETLNTRLAGEGRLLIDREERLAGLERLGLPPAGMFTHASWLRLAEEVDADWVVLGSFRVEDGNLTARARLLDVRRLSLSPMIEEQASFARLLELQGRLAWNLLRQLDPTFPLSLEAFQQRAPRLRVSAFESYVRGLLAPSREQQSLYFLQAARLDPGFAPPAFRLGQLYFEDQDYAGAALWFDKVAPESPLALDARFYLALSRFYAHDFAAAGETLAPLAERLPVLAVWNNLGVFASRRESAQAADYFARALEDDPDDADVYFNLGLHYFRRGDWKAAAEALAQCLQRSANDTEALFLRARALEELGQAGEATRARQQAVGDNPALALSLERRQLDLDRLQLDFSTHQILLNRQQEAADESASARLQHVAVHVERGEDLLARGEVEPARLEFTEAILLDPDSPRAHLLLAEVYRRQGRLSDAVSELKASLWSQENVLARVRLAQIYFSQGRGDEAREQVQAALALDPSNAEARALEANLAGGSGGNGVRSK